jgi:hypothetical protein
VEAANHGHPRAFQVAVTVVLEQLKREQSKKQRKDLLTQKVHLAPNTQQAEQAGFTRAKRNDDVPVNFS